MEKDIAVVYMVAGISNRFGGKIKQFAKVTETETLIEYSLSQALKAGFTKIVFIVGNKTEQPFKEMFGDNYKGIPAYYIFQKFDSKERDKPWGTVDALCSAKDLLNCPFVVCNGDDIYGEEAFKVLTKHLKKESCGAAIGYRLGEVLSEEGSVNRGIFKINNDSVISMEEMLNISRENIQEKNLSEDSLCGMNLFAFHPEILEKLSNRLTKFKEEYKDNKDVECLLSRELNNLIKSGEIIIRVYQTNEKWFGITNPGDELAIKKQLESVKLIKK